MFVALPTGVINVFINRLNDGSGRLNISVVHVLYLLCKYHK